MVIIRPVVTEKVASITSSGVYVFEVCQQATRIQVRNAIRKMYNVTPTSVNIVQVVGKRVRTRSSVKGGKRKDWKKAYVTLPKGSTIQVYEGV